MQRGIILLSICVLAGALLLSCSSGDKTSPSAPLMPAPRDVAAAQFTVTIGTKFNVLQGQIASIPLLLEAKTNFQIGGFDLLIAYDVTALSLTEITTEGSTLFDTCGWEYFNYVFGPACTGTCPSGLVRIVAIAETNNGDQHPSCFSPAANPATMFDLKFLVSNDRTLECTFLPVRFFWIDCSDNVLANTGGDTLLLSQYVYEIDRIDDGTAGFPTYLGTQDTCDSDGIEGRVALRTVDFYNGGFDIVCAWIIDERGDLNLNAINNEVADLQLFRDYFMHGASVFIINPPGQIAASDVNADGLTLTLSDYEYLANIIAGTATPQAPPPLNRRFSFFRDTMWVDSALGAVLLAFEGDIVPELLATNMAMYYNFDGTYTRVLITPVLDPWDWETELQSFRGPFLTAHSELQSLEAAGPGGEVVLAKLLPEAFGIGQNYPNPFQTTTTIPFYMPDSGRYVITISDAGGAQVEMFTGSVGEGYHSITWDASDAPAGMYTYSFKSGSINEKHVMVKSE